MFQSNNRITGPALLAVINFNNSMEFIVL